MAKHSLFLIRTLSDTLRIFREGEYVNNDVKTSLQLSDEQMRSVRVFLPGTAFSSAADYPRLKGHTVFSCINTDSFTAARQLVSEMPEGEKVLVLNFANAFHPGGGVRRGARAQEEDLCRCSSLLLSLESQEARPFYEYNRQYADDLGSDAVILTPYTEVIRDAEYHLLEKSAVVSVITCAAPDISDGLQGRTIDEYHQLFYDRIKVILQTAAAFGYTGLVLGAFGCGVFANDPKLTAELFERAFREFEFEGKKRDDCFRKVVFAVLDRSEKQLNYRRFSARFGRQDRIRGCLIGGAAGDALGYAVEFMSENGIFQRYGKDGITAYEKNSEGEAEISDDTQMTLFTAEGLIRQAEDDFKRPSRMYIAEEYDSWLLTQEETFDSQMEYEGSRLLRYGKLFSRRAPGITCLSALGKLHGTVLPEDFIEAVTNDSKGCGGIMRAAPAGCVRRNSIKENDYEAAQLSAITHHHPLGYMPSAVLAHIISRLIDPVSPLSLKQIIKEAENTVCGMFPETEYTDELRKIIDLSVTLSANDESDLDNIHRIGGGWVAEETLGIALYCSLKYMDDFSKALTVSVNHEGDSDSCGAVTGNILGALYGYDAIGEKWKTGLELSDLILEQADRLADLPAKD